ncbi:tRNA pseudouridine synthase 10 [Pancytospora philotis]|nr:tRNA pseudouridine synthase 10 [Pancytospora philotis]
MEQIVSHIQRTVAQSTGERYDNIVYQIKHPDAEAKAELKGMLVSGSTDAPHTVVEIDFVKAPVKLSRKQKTSIRNARILQKGVPSEVQCAAAEPEGEAMPRITMHNSSIFVYGEYKKLSRSMSQTPLIIGGKVKTDRSVSDFTYEFQRFYGSDPVKFMACGREDIDVRCTGGRPFILEIPCPRRNLTAAAMDLALDKEVDVVNTSIVAKRCKELINQDESHKFYDVAIFSAAPLAFAQSYSLKQKTPLRVLHRRANMERLKEIEVLSTEERRTDEGHYYAVRIRASSGAYIKEWVNGDFGRTVPNLSADLLALDVAGVDKKIDSSTVIRPLTLNKTFI